MRKLFAATKTARARHYDAGRFSFNVAKGRCETCQGEGFVCVELLFLPSVYAPCPTCHGARYNAKTLESKVSREKSIADVLGLRSMQPGSFLPTISNCAVRSTFSARLAWAICDWVNLPPNSLAARLSASSWQPSCSGYSAAPHFTFLMSRPPASMQPM